MLFRVSVSNKFNNRKIAAIVPMTIDKIDPQTFDFASCVKDDVWHPKASPKGHERWYFDAMSDSGKDAVIIVFLDNFILSPRYNKRLQRRSPDRDSTRSQSYSDFPAVVFFYFKDGKLRYRAVN